MLHYKIDFSKSHPKQNLYAGEETTVLNIEINMLVL